MCVHSGGERASEKVVCECVCAGSKHVEWREKTAKWFWHFLTGKMSPKWNPKLSWFACNHFEDFTSFFAFLHSLALSPFRSLHSTSALCHARWTALMLFIQSLSCENREQNVFISDWKFTFVSRFSMCVFFVSRTAGPIKGRLYVGKFVMHLRYVSAWVIEMKLNK